MSSRPQLEISYCQCGLPKPLCFSLCLDCRAFKTDLERQLEAALEQQLPSTSKEPE